MDYSSNFFITDPRVEPEELLKILRPLENRSTVMSQDFIDHLESALDWLSGLSATEDCVYMYDEKWYEWKDHLRLVTERHPYLDLSVRREGSEVGDVEIARVRGGAIASGKAELLLPELDLLPLPDLAELPSALDVGSLISKLERGETLSVEELGYVKSTLGGEGDGD